MYIAICDDETEFADELLKMLECEFDARKVRCNFITVASGEELLEECRRNKIDAAFLDIMMPNINGFEIAEKLREIKNNIMIVFVSNKENTVFSSYKYNPIWFVPKSDLRFIGQVVDKILNNMSEREENLSHIQIKMGNVVDEIDLRKIKYFKTEGHYISYYINNSKSDSFRCKLGDVETQLSNLWFVRAHKRYLINLRQVHSIKNGSVIFFDKDAIPISRSQIGIVKERFQDYLRSIR